MDTALSLLADCAKQFRFYETNHNAKVLAAAGDDDRVQDALSKANTNREMAERIETFLAGQGEAVRSSDNNRPTHQQLVAALQKPGDAILSQLTPHKADLLHMAIGVCGEAGELGDAIKRHAIYGKPLDRANVVEELGDLEFYMEGTRRVVGITREETLEANIDKLSVRYEGLVYSDQRAIDRADKA